MAHSDRVSLSTSPDRLRIWVALLLAVLFLGLVDGVTGHEYSFFVFYFLPIAIAGYRLGLRATLTISLLSMIAWFAANLLAHRRFSSSYLEIWNTLVRLVSFVSIGWTTSQIRILLAQERHLSEKLRDRVNTLEGFLPICARCKKIQNDKGEWLQMEEYIVTHSAAQFSHGYCPTCAAKAFAEAGLPKPKNL